MLGILYPKHSSSSQAEFGRRLIEMDSLPTFPLDVQLHFSAIGDRIGKLEEVTTKLASSKVYSTLIQGHRCCGFGS